jgi:CubicO group peptidase (beta-lactamase class C family)
MGYSTLALIIHRVTGKNWEMAVRERVWQPLGMKDIGFYFRGQPDELFAHGYLKNAKQPVISQSIAKLGGNDWALRGNGGIQASSRTMMKFLDGILDPNGGFPPAARKILLAPVPGQSGEVQEGFGLAFRYEANGKPIRMGHAGSDGTFFSYLGWLRQNDVRIYLVGNNGEPEVKPLVQMALKQALQLPPLSK